MNNLITEIETFDLVIISFSLITILINSVLITQVQKLRFKIKDNHIKTLKLLGHIRKQQSTRDSLKQKQALLETSIHEGASAVESVHQSISDTAFNVMEALSSNNKTKTRNRKLRVIHDHTKSGVYKSVKEVNKQVGVLTDSVLSVKKGKPTSDK